MTWEECFTQFHSILKKSFGEREATGLIRIIKEDYFEFEMELPQGELSSAEVFSMEGIVHQICLGIPVQYAVGRALFDGMKLKVTPAVLIPRPETEELLYWAREFLIDDPSKNYLDIGTGSGCLALGMKKAVSSATVLAVDKSEDALNIAKGNGKMLSLDVQISKMDILDKTQWNSLPKMDGIISNPPYIPFNELEKIGESVLKHEPALALMVPNDDPLLFYRTIGEFAQVKLVENGWLLVEVNEFYGKETKQLFIEMECFDVELRKDISGKDRMILCRLKT